MRDDDRNTEGHRFRGDIREIFIAGGRAKISASASSELLFPVVDWPREDYAGLDAAIHRILLKLRPIAGFSLGAGDHEPA